MGPIYISHRGLLNGVEENTLAAFKHAVDAGFTHIETDLRLSKDGFIVLAHDPSFQRISETNRLVSQMTRSEIEAVPLLSGNSIAFLEDALSIFSEVHWTLDIKPEGGLATLKALTLLFEKMNLTSALKERFKFLFWRKSHEDYLREIWPDIESYPRESECYLAGVSLFLGLEKWIMTKGKTYTLIPKLAGFSMFEKDIVRRIHQTGCRALAFLPKNSDELLKAKVAGFDEILTNIRF